MSGSASVKQMLLNVESMCNFGAHIIMGMGMVMICLLGHPEDHLKLPTSCQKDCEQVLREGSLYWNRLPAGSMRAQASCNPMMH